MKKMLLVLISLITVGGTALAQDQQKDRDRDRIRLYDHLLLKDGRLYEVKQQTQTQAQTETMLQARVTLKNGTVVNLDGSYQLRNGDRLQLRNGECLNMDGEKFKSQDRFRDRMRVKEKQMDRVQQNARQKDMKAEKKRQGGRPS